MVILGSHARHFAFRVYNGFPPCYSCPLRSAFFSRAVGTHSADRFVFVMSTPAEIRDNLRSQTLFRDFSEAELDQFIALLDHERFAPGELIVRQDNRGDCMYLLVKGRAKVVHHQEGHNIELAGLKAGDFFGELALVDAGPRSADVIALEECVLVKITQAAIGALAGVYPAAGFKFLIAIGRILVDRLRASNQRYIDSLLFPRAGKE
jgi:hypothetical protein